MYKFFFILILLGPIVKSQELKEYYYLHENISIGELNIIDLIDFKKKFPTIINELKESLIKNNSYKTIDLKLNFSKKLKKIGSYEIFANNELIEVLANNNEGIINALSTLTNIFTKNRSTYRYSYIYDYPSIKYRYLHLNIIPAIKPKKMIELIKLARLSKFNGIIIQIKNNLVLNSNEKWVHQKAWNKGQMKTVVTYAKAIGLEVIPEVKFLTHQEKFIKDKNLLYNNWTYNPRNPNVYKVVFNAIDEVIEIFNPKIFHIGHDELEGYRNNRTIKNFNRLSHQMFEYDTLKIYHYLNNKGIKTMMWGDMFLDKINYPNMHQRNLHGDSDFVKILENLPKDILIVDWHYWDKKYFKSINFFHNNGFKVFGSTWGVSENIKNFTNKIIKTFNLDDRMMISTTWSGAIKAKKNKLINRGMDILSVNEIIKFSGKVYWNGY